ncbi:beta strand repeat-containing protein [Flavobacterium sp.]
MERKTTILTNVGVKALKTYFVNLLLLAFIILGAHKVSAQRVASVSGNWNSTTTWGGAAVPTSGQTVTINAGVSVTVTAAATCSSLQINNSNGNNVNTTLTINSGTTLTVGATGTGSVTIGSATAMGNGNINTTSLTVSGNLVCGAIAQSPGSRTAGLGGDGRTNLTINSTGVVTATGNVSGTSVNGTGTLTASASLIFSGNGTLNLTGALSPTVFTPSTGTVNYNGTGAQTIAIYPYHNLTVSNARGTADVTFAGTGSVNITGNLTVSATGSSGAQLVMNNSTLVRTYNIGGNFTQTGYEVELGANTATTIVNFSGNFQKTGGYIVNTNPAANATFNFSGTSQNIESSGGTDPIWINYNVLSGSTCTLTGQFNYNGSSPAANFTVNSGGTLNCGTFNLVTASATAAVFTLANGGTLGIGSSAGITSSGATGNIQANVRTFNAGGNYVYYRGGAQAAGNGLPATVGSLAIENNTVLTLPSAKTVTNNFLIETGSSANLGTFTHSAGTLTMGGFGTPNGSHGSTTSAATYKNNTFFAATTGIINVGTGSCSAISAVISGTNAICTGGNTNLSVAITGGLSTYTVVHSGGTVNNYTSGSNISVSPGSTTSYTLTSVRDSNGCPASNSGTATVTVNAVPAAGTLSPSVPAGTVCDGASVSATLTAGTGGAGTIVDELERSLSGGAYAAYTSGASISTAGQTSVSIRTRRTATGSNCTTSGYNTITWTVTAVPASGTLTPNVATGAVCAGTSVSATATAGSGGTGTIVDELQYSLSGGAFTAYTSGTSISTTGQTSVSIRTRRTATGSGCTSSAYNTVTWTVNALPAAGTLTPNVPAGAVCTGQLVSATAAAGSGGAGTIVDELEYSLSGGAFTAYTSGTSINTTGQTSVSIRTRRTATGTGCTTSGYNTVTWTVNALPVSGTLTPTPAPGTICAGTSVSATATAGSGGVGTIVDELEVSLSGGAYSAYTSGSSINTAGETSVSIRTRRTATGSGCTASSYNTVSWTLNPRPTASVISGSAAICSGTTTNIQVAITGGTSPYNVVYSAGSVGSYTSGANIPVAPTTSTTYTLTSVTDANGCVGVGNSGSAVITIDSTTSVNGGPWSNGSPAAGKSVILDGASLTIGVDLTACSLSLVNNSVVTIQPGTDVNLTGAITVESGSTFTLENNANLLQTIPAGTSYANSGNIVVKRNSSALKRLDYTLWSSPVTGQGVYAFSPRTFGNRFYVYRTNTNVYNNNDLGFAISGTDVNGVNGTDSNNVQFAQAKGYLIRMPWNHPTAPAIWNGTFNGVPNNGDISFTMTNGGTGQRFNLVGNPYPSPIDMTQFVFDNTVTNNNITGTLYFWRETNLNTSNNAYCSWAGGTFTSNGEAQVFNPNGVIRTGQGFFVEAAGAATSVNFRNAQRSTDNLNQFFRNGDTSNDVVETNRYWLNLTNSAGAFSQMAAGYMTNATNGVDIYDGRNINTGNVLLNSILDNTDYTIQGKALPFVATDVVPLSYKVTTAGSYTIAIDHVDGLFAGTQAIYLKDNLTATEHNLQAGAYTFASDAGTFNSRFEIRYQPQLSNPVFTANSVVVYSQDNGFVIHSGNTIMASVKVFDIRGRLIEEKSAINASQTTIKGGMANEVLLVQITSEDGVVITKKVIK